MKRRVISVLSNLALLVSALLLGGVLVEIGLRLYMYQSIFLPEFMNHFAMARPDPVRGWALVPNAVAYVRKRDFRSVVHTNSKGLRDVEHAYQPAPGVFRILLVGDSFMEAQQVPWKDTLDARLSRKFANRSVEVINLGVSAYGPAQELLYFEHEGVKYHPNLVIFSFYPVNDLVDDSHALGALALGNGFPTVYQRPYPKWDAKTHKLTFVPPDYARGMKRYEAARKRQAQLSYWDKTATVRLLNEIFRTHETPPTELTVLIFCGFCMPHFNTSCLPQGPALAPRLESLFNASWNVTSKVILAMKQTAEKHNARFLIFLSPGKFQIDSGYRTRLLKQTCSPQDLDIWRSNHILGRLASTHKIPFCDPSPAFIREFNHGVGPLYFGSDDQHWTAIGNRVAAQALAAFLDQHKLVPPPKKP